MNYFLLFFCSHARARWNCVYHVINVQPKDSLSLHIMGSTSTHSSGVINSSHGHIRLGSSVLHFYTFTRFHQFSTSTVWHILQVSSVLFIETITGFCRSPYPCIHQVLSVFYIKRTTRSPGVASSSHAYIRQVSPVFHVDSSTRSPGFINLHIDTFNRFRQLSISWVQHWYSDVSLSSLSEHQMQYLNTASLTWTHFIEFRKVYFSC